MRRATTVFSGTILFVLAFTLAGCTFVKQTEGGAKVKIATPQAIAACTYLGKVTASVAHEVGIIQRKDEAVQENVNVVAQNSAAEMDADTIVPATNLKDGKQTFDAYRCLRR